MRKKVTPPPWLLLLLAALLSSCGTAGRVEVATSPQNLVPLEVTTRGLPQGTVGQSYSAQLTATGGAKPYTWSVPFGELPPGLTLDPSTGLVSGTPTQVQDYSVTVRVADSTLLQQQTDLALLDASIVAPPLVITTEVVPNGIAGQPYAVQFAASGGTPPYAWSVVEGLVPPDLILDPAAGVLSGTPTFVGDYTFTIEVSDSATPASVARLSVQSPSPR